MDVNEDDLDWDGDALLYQGKRFNDILTFRHENGMIKEEKTYVNGFVEGTCREWDENGQLTAERHLVRGLLHGEKKNWHINGTIKLLAMYTNGFEICYDEWDITGKHIVSRKLGLQAVL